MKAKTIAVWLRIIIIGFALCGAGLFGYVIPEIGRETALANPEFSWMYYPWLIFLCVAGVPCFAVLALGWLVSNNFAKDRVFTVSNSKLLKAVAVLAGADSAYFLIGNIVFLFLDMNHPGVLLLSFVVVFIGLAITVAAAALSGLTARAAVMQDENELTI